jgi:hypothetical protein
MNQLLSITDNGDGTYDYQFSQPVQQEDGASDPYIPLYDPALSNWQSTSFVSGIDAHTIRVTPDSGNAGCSAGVLLQGQLMLRSLGDAFDYGPPPVVPSV